MLEVSGITGGGFHEILESRSVNRVRVVCADTSLCESSSIGTGTNKPDAARDRPGRVKCGRAHPPTQRQVETRLTLIQHFHRGGIVMKLLKSPAFLMGLLVTGVILPFQANASGPVGVPEPVSLVLLAVGAAGVGAAAWIRRRKDE
jgi:hypothetical protein